MAVITAITPQVKDKTRCNVFVDGTFCCGMKLETVALARLKVGQAVDEAELSKLQFESEKMTALDKALTHITHSMKTEKEVRDYLKKKGYLAEVCDYVVEKMKSYNYLDDGAYATAYAESLVKDKGRRLIALKLKQKGVSDAEIENAISNLKGEEEGAKRVLDKYMRGKESDKKTLMKAYAYLVSKGYDYDTAKSALANWGLDDED